MLNNSDPDSFRGQTIKDAEIRAVDGRQELWLHLACGNVLAIEGDNLNVADVTSRVSG